MPLERILAGLDRLKLQPQVDPARIVLMGVSRGAELALLVASMLPDVAGVIAFSPGADAWGGTSTPRGYAFDWPMWTVGGAAVPYRTHVPDLKKPLRDWFAAAAPVPAARIQVERIAGPILLVSSRADMIWPAADYADEIERQMHGHRPRHRVQNLQFDDASHLLMGSGPAPTEVVLPGTGGYTVRFGGTAAGTLRARDAGWRAAKLFLRSIERTPRR